MKYELWVYLEAGDFWWKHLTTKDKELVEIKKNKLVSQGHKVKESINYLGVN